MVTKPTDFVLTAGNGSNILLRHSHPVIYKQRVGQREDPIKTMAFHQSQYWARFPCTTL
jgi:hypothetical protein